ncbi:MAG: 50S ribosomal protein L23 [Candidatus Nomurabacteria bacterium]|nr:MAG: 50S ribosomal protein L23 [Candidatus Nomurabacteria bacterium]
MALFGKKKETKDESVVENKPAVVAPKALATDYNLDAIIIAPRLTEKSVHMGEQNVYTFNVKRDATKFQVRDAIKALYNVTPVKVNIVNKKPASRLQGSRNRMKHVAGLKKAYVYLKKGDTINLV